MMSAYRFSRATAVQVLVILLLGGTATQAQVTNFTDNFDGPTLDAGWVVLQPSNHVGFTTIGTNTYYEMEAPDALAPTNSATLQRSPGATNEDFTADLTYQLADATGRNVDYRFTFLTGPGGLLEVVANPAANIVRVFSAEAGANIAQIDSAGLADGVTLNLRVSYDAGTGNVKVGYSQGSDPLALLASAPGLNSFQVNNISIGIYNLGEPDLDEPRILVDRFQIHDEVVPITFATFEDPFDGPTLDPSWDIIQSQGSDHVGLSNGFYIVQKTTTTGEAGLSREFGGLADFYSSVKFQVQDFIGSASEIRFRHPVSGDSLDVILDSAGDVRVEAGGATVAELSGYGLLDGDTLEMIVSSTAEGSTTQVGLRLNGGPEQRIATLFVPYLATSNEVVVIKSATGNGNSPRLLLDHYYLEEGFAALGLLDFFDDFPGTALDPVYTLINPSNHLGLNGTGQYVINTNGYLSYPLGGIGSLTADVTLEWAAWGASDSDLKLCFLGGQGIDVVVSKNSDSISAFSDELGVNFAGQSGIGLSQGVPINLRLSYKISTGDVRVGYSLDDGDIQFLGEAPGLTNFAPTTVDFGMDSSTGGQVEIDVFQIRDFAYPVGLENFVDEFDGPVLDETWGVVEGSNHVGFTTIGTNTLYKMAVPSAAASQEASLERPPGSGTSDFTADLNIRTDGTTFENVDYKFRFFGNQFIEVVVMIRTSGKQIRVYSAEEGDNFGGPTDLVGLSDGVPINLRLSYDADTGDVKVGYSLGSDPLNLLGTATGLNNFQTDNIDITLTRISGSGVFTPGVLIDRFEIQDQVLPITFDSFEDPFDGPSLDASWDIIQSQPSDHVGFIGGGLYEVQKTTTTGEAGLSRDFGGQGDFYSCVEFRIQDFIGSDSRVEFRHPVPGGGLAVILDSAGDVRVDSDELGGTVAEFSGFGVQDGDTLKFSVSTDSAAGLTEVGVQRNGGFWRVLATITDLTLFTPTRSETVLIKSGTGNGNTPRLQFDHYYLGDQFAAVPVEPFRDEFSGPALDPSWFTSDSGTGSLVGFNQKGQYEISTAANVTAGLSRYIGPPDDATFTLTARLADFIGTDSELRFALTGADALTVVLRSDGTVEVVDESGSVYGPAATGVSDGDLVTLQLTIETENGDWEFGLGVNGDPEFVALGLGLSNLNPTHTEITVARGAGGSLPSILLDQTSVIQGFAQIPQAADAFSDDFNSGPLDGDWNVVDGGDAGSHPGYTNSQWYAMRISANGTDINLNRFFVPDPDPGFEEVPVGSFSVTLDVKFDVLVGTNASGVASGTDFKLDMAGGNVMQIVFNSFRQVKFLVGGMGGPFFQDELADFSDGDTVNFGIVYDASGPSVTMSVGLNGTNVFKETRADLVGVAPQVVKIAGFRFNTSQPDLVPRFLLDQLDINPGLAGVEPGAVTFSPAYAGLYEMTWALGELQSAPTIFGTWSNVFWATSPYLADLTETSEFFRADN